MAAALVALGTSGAAGAQTLTLNGGSPTVRVSTAVAGAAPTTVTTSTTSITYNLSNQTKVLQARLNSALPAGLTLQISVTAPSGSTSLGFVTMSTTYANLTGVIPKNASGTVTITHRLTATSAAGAQPAGTRPVTFQLL